MTSVAYVNRATGELKLVELNRDADACPAVACEGPCPRACRCAPCGCPRCVARAELAGRRLEPLTRRPEPPPRLF